jgi:hypothetical protein
METENLGIFHTSIEADQLNRESGESYLPYVGSRERQQQRGQPRKYYFPVHQRARNRPMERCASASARSFAAMWIE